MRDILIIFVKNILALLVISIVMHEFGHWFFFRRIGKKVKFTFEDLAISVGEDKDYVGLTLEQKKNLFLYGIFFGLFPIFFLCLFNTLYVWVLPLYFLGCKTDINNLRELYNL